MLPLTKIPQGLSSTEPLSSSFGRHVRLRYFLTRLNCLPVSLSEGSSDALGKSRQAVVSGAGPRFHGVCIACPFILRKGSADLELALPSPGMCWCVLS